MLKNTSAIGADIGRHAIKVAVVNFGGEVIKTKTWSLNPDQSRDYIISMLVHAVKDIRMKVASKGLNPICIGISTKGFIDQNAGVVLGPDQGIKEWSNTPLAKLVNRDAGLPVYIGNDANLMTIAEQRFGVARDYKNVVFVALRTGIGGGIIINGKLYRGVNNAGGEVGQMIINFDDGMSDKGIRGSFEHLASAEALVRRYAEIRKSKRGVHKNNLSCKEIFELSYSKDPSAIEAVKENAMLVGIGLANLITIFAPEIIVLGGGMSEARDIYINMIRKSALANSLENCRAEVKIERAMLGANATLLGSAYYSMLRLAGKSI
jgi:glucokinase